MYDISPPVSGRVWFIVGAQSTKEWRYCFICGSQCGGRKICGDNLSDWFSLLWAFSLSLSKMVVSHWVLCWAEEYRLEPQEAEFRVEPVLEWQRHWGNGWRDIAGVNKEKWILWDPTATGS